MIRLIIESYVYWILLSILVYLEILYGFNRFIYIMLEEF